jgi:hypothetical protein
MFARVSLPAETYSAFVKVMMLVLIAVMSITERFGKTFTAKKVFAVMQSWKTGNLYYLQYESGKPVSVPYVPTYGHIIENETEMMTISSWRCNKLCVFVNISLTSSALTKLLTQSKQFADAYLEKSNEQMEYMEYILKAFKFKM